MRDYYLAISDNYWPSHNLGNGITADGVYRSGDTLSFSVNFDEDVNVDVVAGTPSISLNLGGNVRFAEYVSGTGTSTLLFQYNIQENDIDTNGIRSFIFY